MTRWRGVAAILAVAVCCAGAAPARPEPAPSSDAPPAARMPAPQSPDRPETPRPSQIVETATTELVLIELYVKDRKGSPVRDLKPDDLILKIDQQTRPKTIVSLEYVEPPAAPAGTAAHGPGAGTPPPAGPGAGPSPGPRSSPSRHEWPRRFLLFFDDATSSPTSMTTARAAAEEFLERPGQADDQFAVVSYQDRRKLEVVQDFTSDRAVLRKAVRASLEDAGRHSDYSAERNQRREEIQRDTSEAGMFRGMPGSQQVEMKKRDYSSEDSMRMSRVLAIMRSLVDGLSPWPGYKALIYIGEGIPENPAFDYGLNDPRWALTNELGGLAMAAGGSNVTLDAVQTEGTTAGTSDQVAAASRRSNALATLALDTGGVARTGNDLLAALGEVEAAAESYYVLAYQPEGPPDGLYHSVNIKTKRKGLTFRYRRAFTRFTPEQARERAIRAAYLAPELHHDLDLDLVAVSGPVTANDRVVDLVIYIPAGRVLFLPDPGGATARLDVGLVGLDSASRETLRVARRVRVSVDAARAASGEPLALDLFSRVHLPADSHTITAVIADVQSGTIGSDRVSIDAAGEEPPGVVGLSLYAVREQSLWLEIDPRDTDREEKSIGHSVGPALRSRFAPGERIECGFRVSGPEAATARLMLAILRDGEEVRRREVARADSAGGGAGPGGEAALHADLPVEGLADGDYVLRVEADRGGVAREVGSVPFSIAP